MPLDSDEMTKEEAWRVIQDALDGKFGPEAKRETEGWLLERTLNHDPERPLKHVSDEALLRELRRRQAKNPKA
jgi:hypothetical protein